jgi:hypothetical protein
MRMLTRDHVIHGAAAGDWWKKQSEQLRAGFAQQVRLGIMSGETTSDIVKRIVGGKVGTQIIEIGGKKRTIPTYAGGIMDATQRDAESLVITATNSVMNATREEVYSQNKDVLKGQALLVTLDMRTTPICRARSGGAWDFKGQPLPESAVQIPFPGPPPYHFRCRSTLTPVTKSWADLAAEAGADSAVVDKLKAVNEKEGWLQASMDGQVPKDLTYDQWLKSKSKATVQDVLGVAKAELFEQGSLTMPEMVDTTGNPLTVDELKQRVVEREAAMTAPATPDGPEVSGSWQNTGGQLGSNPGGTYVDPNGTKWYVKTAQDSDHAANEVLASKLYEMAGVDVAQTQRVMLNGKPAVASRWRDDLREASQSLKQVKAEAFYDGFATDAWLANWDVVGLDLDNIALVNGTNAAVRLDTGGALLFRAKGAAKGKAFGEIVGEITSLRTPAQNAKAASIFGGMSDQQLLKSMDRVLAIKPASITDVVMEFGPGTVAERENLAATLQARLANIKLQRSLLVKKMAADAEAAATKAAKDKLEALAKANAEKAALVEAKKKELAALKAQLNQMKQPPVAVPKMPKALPTVETAAPGQGVSGRVFSWNELRGKQFDFDNMNQPKLRAAKRAMDDWVSERQSRYPSESVLARAKQDMAAAGFEPTDEPGLFRVLNPEPGQPQYVAASYRMETYVNIDEYTAKARAVAGTLTGDERSAIEQFTGSYSTSIRAKEQAGVVDDQIRKLYSGWAKAPSASGERVWRGINRVSADKFNEYMTMDVYDMEAFSSSSFSTHKASGFLHSHGDEEGGRLFFKIKTKTGRFIGRYSSHPSEIEVGLAKGSRYRVTKRYLEQSLQHQHRRPYLVLELEEI